MPSRKADPQSSDWEERAKPEKLAGNPKFHAKPGRAPANGKAGYDYLYNSYRNNAQSDIAKIDNAIMAKEKGYTNGGNLSDRGYSSTHAGGGQGYAAGDLSERGYSSTQGGQGQLTPPTYIQPDLRQRGYEDSRTGGGQGYATGDLSGRGYSSTQLGGGQISPPTYIQPDLRMRGYEDSRTGGGQGYASGDLGDRGYSSTQSDGGQYINAFNAVQEPAQANSFNLSGGGYSSTNGGEGQGYAAGNLSDRGYSSTNSGGGQPIHRSVEENKAIIKFAQSYNWADADLNVDDLSPAELQTIADGAISTIQKTMENAEHYRNIGAPYPGAPTMDRFFTANAINNYDTNKTAIKILQQNGMADAGIDTDSLTPEQAYNMVNDSAEDIRIFIMTPEEIDAEIADAKAKLATMDTIWAPSPYWLFHWEYGPEGQKLEKRISALEMYRPTAVRNIIMNDLPQTVEENDEMIQRLLAQQSQLEKDDPEYGKKNGDFDIQIQALRDNGYYLKTAKDRAEIEAEVLGADDLQATVGTSINLQADIPEYEWVIDPTSYIFVGRRVNPEYNQVLGALNNPQGGLSVLYDDDFKYNLADEKIKKVIRYLSVKAADDEGYKDKLDRYVEAVSRELDKQRSEWMDKTIRDTAASMGWFGKLSAASASMFTNLFSGFALAGAADQSDKNSKGEYEPSNPYSIEMLPSQMTGTMRDVTLEDASPLGKILGDLGFGIGDTLMALPFGPEIAPIILSSEAGGQTARDIMLRGGTPDQALLGGMAIAAEQYFTAKIPIDRLFNIAGSGVKFFSKQGFENILIQAGIQGPMSWTDNMYNTFVDYAVMGDRSQLGMRLKDLIESGMDPAKAQEQAFNEFFVDKPIEAAWEGMIQGGVSAAGANAISDIRGWINPDVDSKSGMEDNGKQEVASTGKVISEIKYKPSSGVTLTATPGKTTTILGNFGKDMRFIIDEMGNVKSTDYGPRDGGFNVLNVPDDIYKSLTQEQFWEQYNKPWLDEAIRRGDNIVLATKPEDKYFSYIDRNTGKEVITGFGKEYGYLLKKGYVYNASTNMMIHK